VLKFAPLALMPVLLKTWSRILRNAFGWISTVQIFATSPAVWRLGELVQMKRYSSECLTLARQSAGYAERNASGTLICTSIAASAQNLAAAACEHAKRLVALCRIDALRLERLPRNAKSISSALATRVADRHMPARSARRTAAGTRAARASDPRSVGTARGRRLPKRLLTSPPQY
jgi:hypothetical protein